MREIVFEVQRAHPFFFGKADLWGAGWGFKGLINAWNDVSDFGGVFTVAKRGCKPHNCWTVIVRIRFDYKFN